jgi:hypothetical protein
LDCPWDPKWTIRDNEIDIAALGRTAAGAVHIMHHDVGTIALGALTMRWLLSTCSQFATLLSGSKATTS